MGATIQGIYMSKGSINKVIIIGTLGRDPEMRFLPNGNAVCSMSLATDEGYKDKNTGQQVDKTEWHRVEAFGRLAEIIGEYLKKGSKCYIEGKLKTDEYEKDGIKRYSTKIVAFDMTMLDSKQQGQSAQAAPQYAPQAAPQAAPQYQQPPMAQPAPNQAAPMQQPAPVYNNQQAPQAQQPQGAPQGNFQQPQ